MNKEKTPYGAHINHLSKIFKCSMKELGNEKGINSTFASIIMFLARHKEGVPQNEIADNAHLKAPTVSLTLKNMENLELITRTQDLIDSRKTIVKLTDKGYEMDEVIKECFIELEAKMIKNISKEDLDNFIRILCVMKTNLLDEKGED